MTTSSNYRELFRAASIVEKLSLFQSLLEASELYVDLALALGNAAPVHNFVGASHAASSVLFLSLVFGAAAGADPAAVGLLYPGGYA